MNVRILSISYHFAESKRLKRNKLLKHPVKNSLFSLFPKLYFTLSSSGYLYPRFQMYDKNTNTNYPFSKKPSKILV